jgi:8-oxo-dGTP pyrophosphatase MutT (NUDIX family)
MKRRPSWFYQQSGVIAYRLVSEELEVLLISSRRRKRWVIPKGVIDPGSTASESACKEAYEEAGIRGNISSNPLGEYQYEKWGGICTVQVFVMEVQTVLETWPEASIRERHWMSPEAAARSVDEPELQHLILKVPSVTS